MDISEYSSITLTTIQETILKNSEKAVISFLSDGQIENGIFIDAMNQIFCFHTDSNGEVLSCVLKDNSVICAISKSKEGVEEIVYGNNIEKNGTVDVDSEGNRWEGNCYKGKIFGYGTFWNGDNKYTYKGYQFGDNQFGYGVKYFSSGIKEYDGYWCAGKRHGKGVLYDKKENVIHEGLWINDEAPENVIRLSAKEDFFQITNQLEEIELGNLCCRNGMNFCLISLPKLRKIQIGKYCFSEKNSGYDYYKPATEDEAARFGKVCFRSCPLLHDIQFIPSIFYNMLSCEFSDLPSLKTLLIRDQSFSKCQSLYFGNLSSLVSLTIKNSFFSLKKAVIEKLPKLKEFILSSSLRGERDIDNFDDEWVEYPNELVIKDLPSLEKLRDEGGQSFYGFGIVKIENVADCDCYLYHTFDYCYHYEIKNADSLKKLIEEQAPHLYRYYSKPFDVSALPSTITSLQIETLSGNEKSLTSITLSNYPELTDITIGSSCFSYVTDFTIEDCDKLQHFTANSNTILMSVFADNNSHFTIRRCKQLETVHFRRHACQSYSHFSISDCPSLNTLEFEDYTFAYAKEFILKDFPMLNNLVLHGSNFYDSETTILESLFCLLPLFIDLPSLSYIGIGYGSLWSGNTDNKEDFKPRLIMKDLPSLKKMEGLADGCFDNVEYFEFENIPSLEEIQFYGGLKHVKEIKGKNADVIQSYFETQSSRGY